MNERITLPVCVGGYHAVSSSVKSCLLDALGSSGVCGGYADPFVRGGCASQFE